MVPRCRMAMGGGAGRDVHPGRVAILGCHCRGTLDRGWVRSFVVSWVIQGVRDGGRSEGWGDKEFPTVEG